jgi:phosphatidylglycerophosphatase A
VSLTFSQKLILFLAQGCGLGWWRLGPGTAGSLGAIFLAWGLKWLLPDPLGYLAMLIVVISFGVWICHEATRILNVKDPGSVVLDEIAAVLLIFAVVPWTWWTALAGFVLFRILDISKPWPIRVLERLPGGWGIMADDLYAGGAVGLILWIATKLLVAA